MGNYSVNSGGKQTNAKKKKRRTRKRKHMIFSMMCKILSFTAIMGAIIAATVIFFKITDISVSGSEMYLSADIIKTAGISVGENMFTFNKFSSVKKIKKFFPFVKTVEIDRKLPDKIVINIDEYEPAGYISKNDKYWLISSDGKLLKEVNSASGNDEISGITEINGVEIDAPSVGENLKITEKDKKKPLLDILQTAEKSAILTKVSKIDMTKLYRITMLYDNRFTVKIGAASELEKKISFLCAVERQLLSADSGTIDVSDTQKARFIPYDEQPAEEESPEEQPLDEPTTKNELTEGTGDSDEEKPQ